MPNRHRILILTSLLLLGAPTVAAAAVVDHIVAVVNNEAITDRDVTLAMRRQLSPDAKKGALAANRKEAMEILIQDKLLAQAMGNANIVVNEEDINRAIRNVMAQYGMSSMDQLRAAVSRQGMSFDQYRDNMKKHIQQVKFINNEIGSQVKISDQDLEDYYRQHMKKFSGTSAVHIAEIVFPIPEHMAADEAKALEARVKEVAAKLNATNFKAMARKYSKGPNPDQGGDLGVVDPKTLPSEVGNALLSMRSGDVSPPIVSKTAITFVMVLEGSDATDRDFERLKDQIYSILYDQRMQDAIKSYVAQLRQNAYVQINE